MKIIKRDGAPVKFEQEKITNAIYKAAKSVGGRDYDRARYLSDQVVGTIRDMHYGDSYPTVEKVQDIVEKILIENGHAKTAKAYILYRKQRSEVRDFQHLLLNAYSIVNEYIDRSSWEVNENSNMNYSLQGLNNHIVSQVTKKYWLEKVYPEEIKNANLNGQIKIHDAGLLAPYCCGWDLADLLLKGFRGAPQKISSAPAKHFKVALGQVVNFLYSVQGEAAGAQAFASVDTYLAPFIRYDKLNYREVKQAIQEFVFNINVPTRVGFQTPFVNFTFDLTVPRNIADEPVIWGGEYQGETYKEFQREMDMFNKAFCEVMIKGDSEGRIFTFPIPTYNVTEDFFDNPVIEDIMTMTARYGIPYFANFINSDLSPEDVRSMCCRLRLDNRELRKRGGGLFGANPLTGSIGVVTLNLPRIGYKAKDFEDYKRRVAEAAEIAKQSLLIKRDLIEQHTEAGLYPYSRYYLSSVYDRFGKYWQNHFSTIGVIGMNESLLNFCGKDITTDEGQALANEIMDHLRDLLVQYQDETGHLFNLEATPGEGTSYSLAKIDKELCPGIITAGEKEPYYTNSTQLPVNHDASIFEILDLQDSLQTKYTGGTVYHMLLGEKLDDTETVKHLIRKVFENYELPYISITPTFSICQEHGYLTGEQPVCPQCGDQTEVWSRIVGYYRPVQNWNPGKKEEYKERQALGEVITV